jgi:hypothetical protein
VAARPPNEGHSVNIAWHDIKIKNSRHCRVQHAETWFHRTQSKSCEVHEGTKVRNNEGKKIFHWEKKLLTIIPHNEPSVSHRHIQIKFSEIHSQIIGI